MATALSHKRNDTVDSFRAIAILAVIGYHYTTDLSTIGVPGTDLPLAHIGLYGVYLFFVISGIVIAITLTRSRGLIDFLGKRVARIYPAYILAMLLTLVAGAAVYVPAFHVQSLKQVTENLQPIDFGQKLVDPSYWSLTPEFKFYALAAISYMLLRRRFWMGLVGFMTAGALLALVHHRLAEEFLDAQYMPFFMLGVGTWVVAYDRDRRGWLVLGIAALLALSEFAVLDTRAHTYPLWAAELSFVAAAGSLIGLLMGRVRWSGGLLAPLGRISYSLYLVHQVIGLTVIALLVRAGIPVATAVALAFGSVLLLAKVMFELAEERGSRLMRAAFSRIYPAAPTAEAEPQTA